MEVRCSNCATEYEFDDALVSARGTSVKCTNCGHQFRVHPTTASPTVAEQWIVRDANNRETTFTSLRDLQQAIVRGQLSPQHQLSHGGQAFRPLEDIYELQTFFGAARQRPPGRPAPRTLLGVGRDGQGAVPTRPSSPPPRKRPSDAPQERITPVSAIPAIHSATTLEPQGESVRAEQPRPETARGLRGETLRNEARGETFRNEPARADARDSLRSDSLRAEPRQDPWSLDAVARTATAHRPPPSPLPPAPYPVPDRSSIAQQPTAPPGAVTSMPWQNMQGLHGEIEAEPHSRKGAGSRWIVAIVVLGGLALIGGTVGRQYLLGVTQPKVVAPRQDERVPALLEQARAALARGDFEGAHAELAKASVLAEGDPRIAAELGRVEVARVELLWAQQRLNAALGAAKAEAAARTPQRRRKTEAELAAEALAASEDAAERKLLEQSFQERLTKAKAAVAEAVRLAPTSIDVVRSQVDLLRLEGELPRARTMVSALAAEASDPDNAYSLGALDLAEGPSGYPSAIERLRVAARTEEGLGRARPLLIYALTQTDPAAAAAELDKLQSVAPTHRSLPALRALVDIAKVLAAPPEPEARRPAPSSSPATPKPPSSAASSGASSGADTSKSALSRANEAYAQGDLDSAESLYRQALQRTPGNIGALSGLGDIARQRNQNATAAAYYDQILKQDRNHVPTLMSRGDMYWESGNRILAVALYRRAVGQLGTGDPQVERAARRIEEFEREVGSVPRAAEPPSRAPGEASPAQPAPREAAPGEIPPIEPPSENAPGTGAPTDEPPAAESPQDSPLTPPPPKTSSPSAEPPSVPAPGPGAPNPSGQAAQPSGVPAAQP
jgi:predicted Zn finger-like uncharacterized protein